MALDDVHERLTDAEVILQRVRSLPVCDLVGVFGHDQRGSRVGSASCEAMPFSSHVPRRRPSQDKPQNTIPRTRGDVLDG